MHNPGQWKTHCAKKTFLIVFMVVCHFISVKKSKMCCVICVWLSTRKTKKLWYASLIILQEGLEIQQSKNRSEERRVGRGCRSRCGSRGHTRRAEPAPRAARA